MQTHLFKMLEVNLRITKFRIFTGYCFSDLLKIAFNSIIKGMVHTKMNFLSLFPHTHVIPNLFCFVLLNTKGEFSLDIMEVNRVWDCQALNRTIKSK